MENLWIFIKYDDVNREALLESDLSRRMVCYAEHPEQHELCLALRHGDEVLVDHDERSGEARIRCRFQRPSNVRVRS